MFTLFKSINRGKKGFTLVEVLIAMVIMTVIMAAVGMTTIQLYNTNEASQNRTLAIRQVQNAGQWISRDAIQATAAPTLGTFNGFNVLTIIEDLRPYENGDLKIVRYSIVNGELRRTEQINGGAETAPLILATNITYQADVINETAPTWFRKVGIVYELKITASVGVGTQAATEVRYYKIEPRPDNI